MRFSLYECNGKPGDDQHYLILTMLTRKSSYTSSDGWQPQFVYERFTRLGANYSVLTSVVPSVAPSVVPQLSGVRKEILTRKAVIKSCIILLSTNNKIVQKFLSKN